jgi:peptide/nickel transport system permease protein
MRTEPSSLPLSPGESGAESPGRKALRRLVRDPRTIVALAVVLLMLAAALTANVLAPYSYKDQARGLELAGPSGVHWFGTDPLGRDILSRLMYGAQVSMLVAICATTVSLVIGVNIGLVAGYLGGRAETVLMRFTDMVAAFPSLLLAVAITALCEKPSLQILVLALGVPHARVIFRHILPNCVSPIIVMATLAVGGNILGEAGLSFLGLGVQEPFPSWGGMLNDARGYFQNFWWVAVFPGLAIVATVLAFNLFGDGLRDALDPRANR